MFLLIVRVGKCLSLISANTKRLQKGHASYFMAKCNIQSVCSDIIREKQEESKGHLRRTTCCIRKSLANSRGRSLCMRRGTNCR